MKKILVNLKDWLNINENIAFHEEVKNLDIILFPAMPYLSMYKNISGILGAQDVSSFSSGAHTGSVSASHLKEFGVSCVLLNHNELRIEDDNILYDKVVHTLESGLDIVLCINDNNHRELERIDAIFRSISNTEKVSIAYEPVVNLTVEEIQNNLNTIRKKLEGHKYDSLIFGGSVSKDNIKTYEKVLNVDGYLISRHALDVNELKEIIKIIS